YFDAVAAFWREVYDEPGLQSLVYRERMQAALGWVEELGLPPGAAVLDAGCGAGLMTLALAQRDLTVSACDSSGEMVERLRAGLAAQGAGGVTVLQADAHTLPFPGGSF